MDDSENTESTSIEYALEKACKEEALIEIESIDDEPSIKGFVVQTSQNLAIVHLLSDRIDLDGYRIIRYEFISAIILEPDFKDFYTSALKIKNLTPIKPKDIDLTDIRTAIVSIEKNYQIVVIHPSNEPDVCYVGKIKLTTEDSYALHMLTPEATWEDDLHRYRYSDIYALDFYGEYERTLWMVLTEREKKALNQNKE